MQPFALRTVISAIIPAILVVILLALLIVQQFQGNQLSRSHDRLTLVRDASERASRPLPCQKH